MVDVTPSHAFRAVCRHATGFVKSIYVFASKEVKVNTPTSLKGRSQLDEETVVRDRRNASKRIHVGRIIGCAKTFKIMKTTTFKISLYCFPQSK